MLKSRDFHLMKVYNISGKYLGVINDIIIDFFHGKIIGFFIGGFKFFKKKTYVNVDDIIFINDIVIVLNLSIIQGLKFTEIKHMDIIDKKNIMQGVVEDLLIDKENLSIKGIIMSSGIFDTMIKGKDVLLIEDCVLCEKFVLYTGKEQIKFKSLPHNLGGKKNAIIK